MTGRPPQYPEGAKSASPKLTAARPAVVKTAAALASLLAATERSVERSRAYHASENLATAYGYYIDEFAWDDTADIFSRDGWKELSYVGTYVGRERIRQSLTLRYPNGKSPGFLTLHQVVQPVIHVSADARSAKIRARLREHVRGRGRHVDAVEHGPRLRLGCAVTRRLGPRQDASHRAGGCDGQDVPARSSAAWPDRGAVPQGAGGPVSLREPGVGPGAASAAAVRTFPSARIRQRPFAVSSFEYRISCLSSRVNIPRLMEMKASVARIGSLDTLRARWSVYSRLS